MSKTTARGDQPPCPDPDGVDRWWFSDVDRQLPPADDTARCAIGPDCIVPPQRHSPDRCETFEMMESRHDDLGAGDA